MPCGSTLRSLLEGYPDRMCLQAGTSQDNVSFPTSFPYKVMEFLSRPDIKEIISWREHGRSFTIYQPERFEKEVLIFTKYKSFIRSLNLWGFKRITRGPDAGSYYHQVCLRTNTAGVPGLLCALTQICFDIEM